MDIHIIAGYLTFFTANMLLVVTIHHTHTYSFIYTNIFTDLAYKHTHKYISRYTHKNMTTYTYIHMVKKYQDGNPYWANVTKTFAL